MVNLGMVNGRLSRYLGAVKRADFRVFDYESYILERD
jgi:hypothetical protein